MRLPPVNRLAEWRFLCPDELNGWVLFLGKDIRFCQELVYPIISEGVLTPFNGDHLKKAPPPFSSMLFIKCQLSQPPFKIDRIKAVLIDGKSLKGVCSNNVCENLEKFLYRVPLFLIRTYHPWGFRLKCLFRGLVHFTFLSSSIGPQQLVNYIFNGQGLLINSKCKIGGLTHHRSDLIINCYMGLPSFENPMYIFSYEDLEVIRYIFKRMATSRKRFKRFQIFLAKLLLRLRLLLIFPYLLSSQWVVVKRRETA